MGQLGAIDEHGPDAGDGQLAAVAQMETF